MSSDKPAHLMVGYGLRHRMEWEQTSDGGWLIRNLSIDIGIPPATLSPNGRVHWARKSKAKKHQRQSAKYVALAAIDRAPAPAWPEANVMLRWHSVRNRWPDADNAIASVKGAIDGLVDAGVLADDDKLTWHPMERLKDPKNPRVEIVVWVGDKARRTA